MPKFTCRDECGVEVTTPDTDLNPPAGWRFLEVTKRFRCARCCAALDAMQHVEGKGAPTPDLLPPTSRGALPKDTSHTISEPSVPR